MSEEKVCSVCRKQEASTVCFQCKAPLCHSCRKQYYHEELGPWGQTLGVPVSQIWTAQKYFDVCPDCFKTLDIYDYLPEW